MLSIFTYFSFIHHSLCMRSKGKENLLRKKINYSINYKENEELLTFKSAVWQQVLPSRKVMNPLRINPQIYHFPQIYKAF